MYFNFTIMEEKFGDGYMENYVVVHISAYTNLQEKKSSKKDI